MLCTGSQGFSVNGSEIRRPSPAPACGVLNRATIFLLKTSFCKCIFFFMAFKFEVSEKQNVC